MDNALRQDLAPDDGLKRVGRTVRDPAPSKGSVTLVDAEDRLFKRAPASFAGAVPPTNPGGAKEAFINLDYAQSLLFFGSLVETDQPP